MQQHLIDTPLKLAVCPRCSRYVLVGYCSGLKTAVDPAPIGLDGYRAALVAREATYDLMSQAGRPWKLRPRTPSVPPSDSIVKAHGCGALAISAAEFDEEAAPDPLQAPVTPGRPEAGRRPGVARENASRGHTAPRPQTAQPHSSATPFRSAVRPANPRPSKRWLYRHCERCGEQIGYADVEGVMYRGMWEFCFHAYAKDCKPAPAASKEGKRIADD